MKADVVLNPLFRRVRSMFVAESDNPFTLWLATSECVAMWIRYIDHALGVHLEDRHRARAILTAAHAEMLRRRVSALPAPLTEQLPAGEPLETRAFFEALSPGPVARSIRWSLEGIAKESPNLSKMTQAWRRVRVMDAKSRWLEVSHHIGEMALVLGEYLPEQNVPHTKDWLGDVCHAFGKEVAELAVELFHLPLTSESANETLRMGEFLFRINPEWKSMHSEILGRFQDGIAEVFGSRGKPLVKAIHESPLQTESETQTSTWQPPTSLKGYGSHAERMAALARGKDPLDGFVGSQSLFWKCSRESVILLGGGRAALMQLAHPAVAHAVRDHSVVHTDMLGRFMRTMSSAYGVVFGSIDEVRAISDKVYKIHSAIAGKLDDVPGQKTGHYYALDPEAVFWVGATLTDTVVLIYEQMVRPLEEAEKDRLLCEINPFWVAFGVPLETLPTKWKDIRSYVLRRTASLAPLVGTSARQQASLLFAPHPALTQPAFDQVRLITAYLLPDSLRRAFGMELNAREQMLARSWLFAAERARPWLPSPVRFVPTYHQATWRLWRAGRSLPSPA